MVNKILFVFVVFFMGVVMAYASLIPNPGHGGDIISISIDGSEMTLQKAIDDDLFLNLPKSSSSSSVLNPGHSANQIWVSVDGVEKTLQDAISTTGLCGSVLSSCNSDIVFGHSASEILVSVDGDEMTFQDAINSGKFCIVCTSHTSSSCYNNDVYWYNSCDDREEKKEECGVNGCSGGSCATGGTWSFKETFGSCDGWWSPPYCSPVDPSGMACPTIGAGCLGTHDCGGPPGTCDFGNGCGGRFFYGVLYECN